MSQSDYDIFQTHQPAKELKIKADQNHTGTEKKNHLFCKKSYIFIFCYTHTHKELHTHTLS